MSSIRMFAAGAFISGFFLNLVLIQPAYALLAWTLINGIVYLVVTHKEKRNASALQDSTRLN